MWRFFALLGLVAGLWLATSPWIGTQAASGASTGGMHGMGGMTHSAPAATTVITASSYYWHIVPGALAVLVSVAVLLWGPALARFGAFALGVLAIWSAVGPWVLPHIGMGSMIMSGLDAGTFVRHVLPGIALAVAAVGLYFSTQPARAPQPAQGWRASG